MPRWYDSAAAHRIARGGFGLALGGLLVWPWMCAYWRTGSDISVACIVLGYLLRTAALKRWHEWKDPLWISIGAMALWVTLIAPFARNDPALLEAAHVWWKAKPFTFTLISGLWWLRFPAAFWAVSTWLLTDERPRKWMLISAAALLGVVMADTWTQFISGHSWEGHAMFSGQRLTGPLTHPNIGMMIAKIGVAILGGGALWALEHRPLRGPALWGMMTLSGAMLVLLSGERMPALLLLAGFFSMGLFLAYRQPSLRRFVIPACLGLALLTASLMMLSPFMHQRADLLIEQVQNLPRTEYGQLYKAAWILWLEAPFQGIGLRHFDPLCPTVLAAGLITKCNAHPHNVYLEWLSEAGLFGLLGYLAIIATACLPLWRALRSREARNLLPTATLLGMAILCFFPFMATQSNFNGWAAGLTWVGFGLATAYLRAGRNA